MSEMSQPPVPAGSDASGPRAGFGQRLGAMLIDIILLGVVQEIGRAHV